jgi:hypothetical protein
MRNRKPTLVLAVFGLAIAVSLFTYLEMSDYSAASPLLRVAIFTFCPPSALSFLFIDIEPHTVGAFGAWFVIALMNSVLYGTIGTLVGRYLCKAN